MTLEDENYQLRQAAENAAKVILAHHKERTADIEAMANLHVEIVALRSALDQIDMEANGALNNGFADCHAVLVTIQGIAGRALAST